jgi:hypothetical protein
MPKKRSLMESQNTLLLAGVAVALIVGFLVWLALVSEPTTVAIEDARGGRGGEEQIEPGVTTVPGDEFGTQPLQYQGQQIRLTGVQVASRLGAQAFWVELPTQPQPLPYLIRLDTTLVRQGFAVQSGQSYNVTGQVYAMTDSVLSAWEQQGVLQDEMQRMEAEFASSFLEVRRIMPAVAPVR